MPKNEVLGLIRHVLTFGGGYAVASGVIDEGTAMEIVGGIMTLIGAIWSWRAPEKKQQ